MGPTVTFPGDVHVVLFRRCSNGAVEHMLSKPEPSGDKKEPVVVKKYANRRLYNTETSTYVTLDDLAAMVRAERDFVVFDAKSGEDLTHTVLTQIIVEQESRAGTQTLLPVPFLRQLIRFYGDTMERMVPSYLQVSLETLAKEQERFRKQFTTAFTPHGAFEAYQEQARKNLAMFEQAITMFAPFSGGKTGIPGVPGMPGMDMPRPESERADAGRGDSGKSVSPATGAQAPGAAALPVAGKGSSSQGDKRKPSELDELKAQLAAMQAKLEKLSSKD